MSQLEVMELLMVVILHARKILIVDNIQSLELVKYSTTELNFPDRIQAGSGIFLFHLFNIDLRMLILLEVVIGTDIAPC